MIENQRKALPSLELLLDYLDGILDQDSAQQIEIKINESEELKSILEGIKLYYESEGKDRAKLEIYADQIRMKFYTNSKGIKKEHVSASQKPSFWIRIAATVAVVLIAGIALFYNLDSTDADKLISNHLQNRYEAPITLRGGETTNQLVWGEVINSYQQNDFESALNSLEELPESDNQRMMGEFYKGLCYLYQETANYSKAVSILLPVSSSEHRLNERAEWFLALAYYKNGDMNKARLIFQKIARENLYKKTESERIFTLLAE